ncbi:unnamed protein product [Linum trigynum]|uniref:Zinc knuckle CX2CX4HX4C domain-containing protein n=1 Tax=Linum trigynum TaxID=586398 RepID=A0AAV2FVH9_9ROSI
MPLSSLSLTDTFSEPSNGSFSIPLAGTPPALAKSNLVTKSHYKNLPHPPTLHKDDISTINPGAGKILMLIGLLGEEPKDGFKKREVWKPPDSGNKGSPSQSRGRRSKWKRGKSVAKSLIGEYAIHLEQNEDNIEPRASVMTVGKQGKALPNPLMNTKAIDKKDSYLIQEGREVNRRGKGFKGRWKRGREGCAHISSTAADSPWLLLVSLPTFSKEKIPLSQTKFQTKLLCPRMESINNEANTNQGRGSLVQSLTRGRGGRLILSSTGGRGMSMLLGKMLTESKVALAKAAGAARYAWGSYGEVNIQPTETPNLFLFTFKSMEIRDKIWEERPRSLSNTMTAIEKYNGRGKPEDVSIEKMAMWVQIHGLHQNQRSEENMVAIGSSYLLELLDIDRASLECTGYRRFLRILVEVDIRKPVPVGFNFPFLDEFTGVEHCDAIEFKYERLVELCYFCGRIVHNWPTCRRMNEERKKNGVAYLSDVYTASLKAGIDSPHRSSAAQARNRGEGRGSYRRNEAVESDSAAEMGGSSGGCRKSLQVSRSKERKKGK